jgi:deazaflavin-dependent oxidoreductase (nitroreductase family)
MSIASSRPGRTPLLSATRLVNPLVLVLAGTRVLPLYGVITHRGRRSGKVFRTPVVVRPTSDGFVVPMPWGEQTDWYRNVLAAGECVIRWKGRDYSLVEPEVISDAAKAHGFSALQRVIMARLGINRVLRLRFRSETDMFPARHKVVDGSEQRRSPLPSEASGARLASTLSHRG